MRLANANPSLLASSSSSDDNENGKGKGGEEGAAVALARRIKMIWVSHPHADHHLGITRVLAECKRHLGSDFTPVIVVAPPAVLLYLQEYAKIDPGVRDSYLAVSTKWLEPSPSPSSSLWGSPVHSPERSMMEFAESEGGGGGGYAYSSYHLDDNRAIDATTGSSGQLFQESLSHAKEVWQSMGIKDIVNVKVDHCRQAYGVKVTLGSPASPSKDFKLVYSGDTRPCDALVQLGKGASLLIHEATFGDDKGEEAINKKHSTIGEAVDVGRRMGAYRTLLTHFSQRYPSAPPFPLVPEGPGAGTDATSLPPVLAFDFMHLAFRDLLWAPATTPALAIAFPVEAAAHEDEEEDEEGGKEREKDRREARRVDATVPGAFARIRGPRQCACCVGIDEVEEDIDSMTASSKATDKMRRKRKLCLRDLAAASKPRGTKL